MRLKFKASETPNGLLIEGYAFMGIHDPEELDKQVKILGLFEAQPMDPDGNQQPDWVSEIQLSGSFRIRGKAYAPLSTPEENFWVEEGKYASGYKLIKLDLTKSQPSALIQKEEEKAWVGLRLGDSTEQLDMVNSFQDGGLLFIKKIKSGDKISLPMKRENGEKPTLEMNASLN